MNTFEPGDIVSLKDKVSPQMMVIGEIDGMVTAFWQDAVGGAKTGEYPTNWLKPLSVEGTQLPSAIRRVAELLKGTDEERWGDKGSRGAVTTLKFSKYLPSDG